jgi:hypothetical protein
MRIILAIALLASLLASCAPAGAPEWVDKVNKDNTSPNMGGT